MSDFPLERVRRPFRAAAVAIVPELARATPAEWTALEATIGRALANRPPRLVRQLTLFVRLLDLAARGSAGRPLDALDPARRDAVLRGLERSRWLLVRRGLAGLRTLVFMGYYTDPGVAAAIGYRPSAAGWDARR